MPQALDLKFRTATEADYDPLGEVMHDAVRNGPSQYSEKQRSAWVPQPRTGSDWNVRLGKQYIVVAESRDRLVGFMSLAEAGYIDFAYIRPGSRGQGIFKKLFQQIQRQADKQGLNRLWVHASLNAKDAFESLGFQVVRKETVTIGDVELNRFEMEKMAIA